MIGVSTGTAMDDCVPARDLGNFRHVPAETLLLHRVAFDDALRSGHAIGHSLHYDLVSW